MKKDSKSESAVDLRRKAEELLKRKTAKPCSSAEDIQTQKLIHELEVHQIELEMQNDELQVAKAQIIADAKKYTELYNFAPMGYFTLTKAGEIVDLNLCGSQMLGKKVEKLKKSMFGFFVSERSKPIFNQFIDIVFSSKSKETCEIALQANSDSLVYVNLSGTVTENDENCLIIATDISEIKKEEEEIKKLGLHFRDLIEKAPDGIVLLDAMGNFRFVSSAAKKIFGFQSAEEIIGSPAEYTHPDDLNRVLSAFSRIIEDPSYIPTLQYRYRDKTGNWLWVESTFTNLLADPSVESILINFRDITEQKQAEEQLYHVTRLYAFLGQVNQAIVRNRHENELFRKICEVAVGFGQFRMAWIGLTDETDGRVKPVAISGFEDRYLDIIHSTTHDGPTGKGPAGQALRQNKVIICNDISKDPLMFSWRDEALRRGYRSSVSVPFSRKGKLDGTLNIYSAETGFFIGDHVRLLEEICANITFALEAITSETEKRETVAMLRESEEQYSSLFNNFLDSVAVHQIVLDETGKPVDYIFLQANAEFESQTGLKIADIIGKKVTEVIPGIEKTPLIEIYGKVAIMGEPIDFEQFIEPLQRYFHINAFQIGESRFCTVFQDITDRRQFELILIANEQKYRTLFENMSQGVFYQMADGAISDVNEAALEMFGLSRDQFLGRTSFDPQWKITDEQGATLAPQQHPSMVALISGKPCYNTTVAVYNPSQNHYRWLVINAIPGYKAGETKPDHVFVTMHDISERKQAEEALIQNRDLLGNLARLVPGVIYQYRLYPDGRSAFPYASPGMNDIYEVTPEEVQEDATPVFGRLHPEDFDHVVEAIQESARTLNTFYCEYRVKLPRQGLRWRWSQAQPLRLEDGSILWHGIISDITEGKQSEERLKKSEQKFRGTISNLDEGYYSVTMDGLLLEHNQAFSRILGFDSTADLKGVYLPDYWKHPDERKKYLEAISANNSVSNYQINVLSRTGENRSVLANAHVVNDENGHPLRIEGVFLDITDRILMEASLQRHAERLQNLHKIDKVILSPVETPEAIIQKTLQHIRSLLSSQHASIGMFDFEKETLQLFTSNIKDQSMDVAKRYLINNALGDLEILRGKRMDVIENISTRSLPPDLQQIFQSEGIMSCINVPLISGDKLIGAMNLGWEDPRVFTPEELEIASEVADEITVAIEQVRLRQAAKHYAGELEKRVEERTSQLLAANKELEAFSYSVSHDLRAPLRHINGYVSILSKHLLDKLSEKEKHYLNSIAGSAHQMGVLIDDLLHFSRTGRQEMQLTSLDMNVVLKDALQVIKHESFGRGIKWVVAGLPQVTGDYALLRLVWLNLLSNAVKFCRTNVISQIEIGVVDDINEFLFFVRDNGVGFDMQYAHKLFGVFERLHSAQEFEGTGIGLANVRRIIQRHGGRTWAEAEVGKGATFYFSLPKG